MTATKFLIIAAFAVAVAIAIDVAPRAYGSNYASKNKSHHLIVGSRMPGDHLVYTENIIKNSKWLQIVTVEKTFNISKYSRITQLQALDQKTNGNGAFASLLYGGPGFSNVTLKFKSQRSHGINFTVHIYARS